MSFRKFPTQANSIQLLQRSLEKGRLGHAYIFSGTDLLELENVAATLGKTLNCELPIRGPSGNAIDCCNKCLTCRKIDSGNYPDIHWIRPESKLRIITINQMRQLMSTVNLKPTQGNYKVAVIVAADRLNPQAANAFLKTLEEPPSNSVFILLSLDASRLLETILSRCLRLSFGGSIGAILREDDRAWLAEFSAMAAEAKGGLLARYRLLGSLLQHLTVLKEQTETNLTARSPLEKHEDIDARLRDKWEVELTASIESEYRRRRAELLIGLQWWLRDVWLLTQQKATEFLSLPDLGPHSATVAQRINGDGGLQNLRQIERTQQLLATNVQEALALEVGLLKLKL